MEEQHNIFCEWNITRMPKELCSVNYQQGVRDSVVKAPCYKPEGRGVETR
jgi:hypothetical protein